MLALGDGGAMAITPDAEQQMASELAFVANEMRHDIITMLEAAGSGHPGGSLSCVEMLVALFFGDVMSYNRDDPHDPNRDHFILSKGHAAPAYYAIAKQLGWIDQEEITSLRKLGSRLQGHIDNASCPGVDLCSGSLGQGLSVACGLALSFMWDTLDLGAPLRQVFCVCGDGEMQEGSNWEALMFAAHQKMTNITLLIDLNNLQIDGHVSDINSLGDIEAKLGAFGWRTIRVDGHDTLALIEVLKKAVGDASAPYALVCDTIKGKGVSFMEDRVDWHGVAPNAEQAAVALAELDAQATMLRAEAESWQ